jgi:DnaK suppressor protein
MAGQKSLSKEQLSQFREQLQEMRDRLLNEVERGVESIRSEINPVGNLSTTPIHLADAASGQLDADIYVNENERDILQEVQEALHRIDGGHFGTCVSCGSSIPPSRLQVIPYTSYCVDCASRPDEQDQASIDEDIDVTEDGMMRLTGFEAIEFAEREGFRLNKAGDSIDDAAKGLTIAEAEAIASDNPDLIWLEIPSDSYGVRKNMRPGR